MLSAGLSRLSIDSGRLAKDGISYDVEYECAAGAPHASLAVGTVLRTILLEFKQFVRAKVRVVDGGIRFIVRRKRGRLVKAVWQLDN